MNKPRIMGFDCYTNEAIDREMTDEEYAELLASGWTEEAPTKAGDNEE